MAEHPAHLAVLIPNLTGGGAERFAINISGELSKRGHRVDLVVGSVFGPLVEKVADGVRVVELGRRHNSGNLLRLIRYLRRERPDGLLSSQPGANVISVLGARIGRVDTRIVVTQHISLSGVQSHPTRAFKDLRFSNLGLVVRSIGLDRAARWALPRAHRIVAVSEGVADGLSRQYGIPSEAISVVYNPVVTPQLLAAKEGLAEHAVFDKHGEPVIVAVGRFEHQKGFDVLIEALAILRRDVPANLLLLGDGPEREALEQLAEAQEVTDAVFMPGHLDGPVAFMRRASVFALSSRYEGLPTVLIEGLCAGVPVVSTNCESGPREILEGGKHGVLVPVEDPTALAAGLAKALAGEVAPPAPETWERFTGERAAAEYEKVLLGPLDRE